MRLLFNSNYQMTYKFPLPLFGGYETTLNETRLLEWLRANVNDEVTTEYEIYDIPYTDYHPDGELIPKDHPNYEIIWNRGVPGIYELRTKYITTDWEYVHRYHVDVGTCIYGSTIHETYFVINDDVIAVQFKLANNV